MKKIIFIVIILIFLFIINNFFHSIYGLWQKQDLITEARRELSKEKQEQQQLKKQIQIVSKPSFIEQEARDKLLLVKPGEEVVVLPEASTAPQVEQKSEKKPHPSWEQWYRLFF